MPSDYQSELDDEFNPPRHQRAFVASLFFGILALLFHMGMSEKKG